MKEKMQVSYLRLKQLPRPVLPPDEQKGNSERRERRLMNISS